MKSLALINRHPPYGSSLSLEALDAALAVGVFDPDLTIFFIDDGVLQLMPNQSTQPLATKSLEKGLTTLAAYGIDNVIINGDDLAARGIQADQIGIPITVKSTSEIAILLTRFDMILSF